MPIRKDLRRRGGSDDCRAYHGRRHHLRVYQKMDGGVEIKALFREPEQGNEWIEDYHNDGEGEIDVDHKPVLTHVDILERDTFSGINFNLGMLWDISRHFTLGLVYKTPFEADLEYTKTIYRTEKYPNNPSLNLYDYDFQRDKEQLKMPA